jgi:malonyl-CoA decarboxylase
MSNARIRFFKRLAALHGQQGASLCDLHFLIGLRAGMLRWHKRVPGLRALDDDLEALFSGRRPVAQGARAVLRHDGE